MRVSEYLRQYQLTGKLPEKTTDNSDVNSMLPFWSGWLVAVGRNSNTATSFDDAREIAIKAAEFIESQT